MQQCLLAGVGFSSPWLLSGCDRKKTQDTIEKATDTLSDHSAGTSSSDQHKFLKTVGGRYKGTKIRIVSESTPPSIATNNLAQKEFSPLTGIEVEWVQLPLERVFAQIVSDTSLQRGTNDIYYLDQA